jgi:hypothetical protein
VKLPPPWRLRWINVAWAAFSAVSSGAQNLPAEGNFGGNISLNFAIGTHFQRIGVNIQPIYVNDQFQANFTARAVFNLRAPGPRGPYAELTLSPGLVFGYGPPRGFYNPFFSQVSNQTRYENSISYSYNVWLNRIGTRQLTGIVAISAGSFGIVAENDILAAPTLDRFRTGAFLITFQHADVFEAAVNCMIWTGEFGHKQPITGVKAFFNGCYMDTTGGKFTSLSHGMLSLQVKYNMGYGQAAQANFGLDAEQIRDAVQNRLMHNLRFWPQKWMKTKNCHLPMTDDRGRQYLYGDEQKIRPVKPYFNVFGNANLFY